MIIKMQIGVGWHFIGNLQNVENYPFESCVDSPMRNEDFDEVYYGISSETGYPMSVFVRAKRENGKDVGVVANRSVFLLNDNGKTIERLN